MLSGCRDLARWLDLSQSLRHCVMGLLFGIRWFLKSDSTHVIRLHQRKVLLFAGTAKIRITTRLMDYTEQRKFLRSSRIWGAALVLLLFAAVGACIQIGKISSSRLVGLYAALAFALAIFMYYTPDYLHLSVDPTKRSRWAVKIRWRIIAAVLIMSALSASNTGERVCAMAAILWLVALTLFARKLPRRFVPVYFWLGEAALLAALLLIVRLDLLLATLLLAAVAHLAI